MYTDRDQCIYRVDAECSELARNILFRYLNRELSMACKKYNIILRSPRIYADFK